MTYLVFLPVIAAVLVTVVVIARQRRPSADVATWLLLAMCFGVVAIAATRLVAHTVFPDDDTAVVAASYAATLLVFVLTAPVAIYRKSRECTTLQGGSESQQPT